MVLLRHIKSYRDLIKLSLGYRVKTMAKLIGICPAIVFVAMYKNLY